MRYMMIMQVEPEAAARAAEDLDMEQVVAAMGAYNEDLQKAGVFLSAEGLSDASDGFRVDFSSTPPVVTDGPYAEAREVFTGFWILEVANREEAEHWAKKCPLGPGVGSRCAGSTSSPTSICRTTTSGSQKAQEWRAAHVVSSGRVGSHRGIPAAVRAAVAEQAPHRPRERRVLQRDLAQHAVVPRGVRARAAVGGDVLGAQREARRARRRSGRSSMNSHGSSPAAQSLVHEHREFVGGLGPQQLETGPAARGLIVRRHSSSLRCESRATRPDARLR